MLRIWLSTEANIDEIYSGKVIYKLLACDEIFNLGSSTGYVLTLTVIAIEATIN